MFTDYENNNKGGYFPREKALKLIEEIWTTASGCPFALNALYHCGDIICNTLLKLIPILVTSLRFLKTYKCYRRKVC